jgi:AraC-like DNA-binding protein
MIKVTNIKPIKHLEDYVNKISIFETNEKIKFKHKLTPSAFTYFSYNDQDIPTSIFGEKRVCPKTRFQIAGPKVDEDIWVEYNGSLRQILLEFTGTGFFYLFHNSPFSLKNQLTDLKKFISSDTYSKLEAEINSYSDIDEQVKIIEDFFMDISYNALPFADYIEAGIRKINQNKGNINLSELTEELGIGQRQFNRKFQKIVGVTPKYYAKIQQLNYVLSIICSKNYSSIQDLAYRGEFYDLPHFVHTFKKLTGLSPSEFIKSDRHIALKYFSDIE